MNGKALEQASRLNGLLQYGSSHREAFEGYVSVTAKAPERTRGPG